MKTSILKPIGLFTMIAGVIFLTAFDYYKSSRPLHNTGGTASSCGSPGELGTCSRPTCHGAGATPAGIADNAGPGTLSFTTSPAIVANQYIPGTTYTVTVTISQTGKKRFGFACEILDNSGSSNGHINNTAGTVVVTDHINTRIWQAYGTGRLSITHDTNGGFTFNSYSYHFNWIAPAAGFGTVNIYLCGNATNADNLADSSDYVYTKHMVLTEGTATGINQAESKALSANIYPNPVSNSMSLTLNMKESGVLTAELYSMDGKMVRMLENNSQTTAGTFEKTYELNDLPKGIYFLRINANNITETRKVIVE